MALYHWQVIEERISKKVASVGIMCKLDAETKPTPPPSDNKMAASKMAASAIKSTRDASCGDDTIDMFYSGASRTSGLKKSIGVGEKLIQINRAMNTDKVTSCDASTSASIQKASQAHKATATIPVTMYPASTSTDIAIRHHAHTETDTKIFQATNQVKNSSTNTDQQMADVETVQSKTAADKVKVAGVADAKVKVAAAVTDKAVNTLRVSLLNRSVNTDRLATRNMGSNTDVTSPVYTDDDAAPTSSNKTSAVDAKSIKSIMKQPGSLNKKVKKELSFSEDVDVEEVER